LRLLTTDQNEFLQAFAAVDFAGVDIVGSATPMISATNAPKVLSVRALKIAVVCSPVDRRCRQALY